MPDPQDPTVDRAVLVQDAEQAAAFVAKSFVPIEARATAPDGRIGFEGRWFSSHDFIACHTRFEHGLEIRPRAELDCVNVSIGLKGAVRCDNHAGAVVADARTIVVRTTRSTRRLVFEPAREEVVISIGGDAFRDELRRHLGHRSPNLDDFVHSLDARTQQGITLSALSRCLQSALYHDGTLTRSPVAVRRYRDAFIDLVFFAVGDAVVRSWRLSPSASTAELRRAEEFMRAHADRPIGIGDVADHLGMSVRSLQLAFKRHRGVTPLATLTGFRLDGVRRDLDSAQAAPVAVVAAKWGFTNLSRMSRQYLGAYGERPSQTVRRAQIRG